MTNLPVPFYLVGSIHNLRGDDYPLADVYRRALKDSSRLLFEYNPKERETFGRKFRAASKYAPGEDIRSQIRPATLTLLQRSLRIRRMRFEDIRQYRPWAIALRLLALRGYAGATSAQGVDQYLAYHAQRLGKEVAGLETVDEHLAFWKEMLDLEGENLLLYTITRTDRVTDRLDETRGAWKRGDMAALSATNTRLREVNPRTAQRLLDRRNLKWLPRIEAEMKTGKPTAIVAGAGHFSGPHNVIELLQKRGYKIEQL